MLLVMTAPQSGKLPPGSTGLPGLGESLSFLKDPYAFVRTRELQHGPVFKTSLFGKKTAVIIGREAAARYIDAALVEREGSQPQPIFRLFAGPSVPHLDGAAHAARKKTLLQAFTRDALTAYLPRMQSLVESFIARWAERPEVRIAPETKRLALEAVAQDMLGITAPEELDRLEVWYTEIQSAFTALPVPIPGTKYSRGLKALDGVLAYYRDVVHAHREKPGVDGLSRILALRTPSGEFISDDAAARELHHLLIAGRVVFAHLVTAFREVAMDPKVRDCLCAEIRAAAPAGPLSVETLHEMKYLTEVLLEVKRTSPVVPGMFGRAKTDIAFGEYTIPRGWMIMYGLRQSLVDGGAFPHPERFEPERFGDPRNEHKAHEHALVPHGPGKPETSHHCAGTDYASQLVRVFLVTLLRSYDVELPEQDLEYDWAKLTPDPKDGLRARITKNTKKG